MTTAFGIRTPVMMTFRSEPSGFTERMRPALASRKNKRLIVFAWLASDVFVANIVFSFHWLIVCARALDGASARSDAVRHACISKSLFCGHRFLCFGEVRRTLVNEGLE